MLDARIATPREIEAAEALYMDGFTFDAIGSVDELGHVYITDIESGIWVLVLTDNLGFKHGLAGDEATIRAEFRAVEKKYADYWGMSADDV